MGGGQIAIEGQGEVKAVGNLICRLWQDLRLSPMSWADPIRPGALHTHAGISRACSLARRDPQTEALVIIRDADDDCPRASGPATAGWVTEQALPFPCAVVLLCREYETLFLPCLARMAGVPLRDDRNVERAGLLAGTTFEGDFEQPRGVKEWLSRRFPTGRKYKPTLDQLPMTRLLDFEDLRKSGLSSFGTLERALRFLDANRGGSQGLVYPPSTS